MIDCKACRKESGVCLGDRVIVRMRHGGYTDEAVVAPAQLTPLPKAFDHAEGATFLAAHGTAHHALVDRGQLGAGEVLHARDEAQGGDAAPKARAVAGANSNGQYAYPPCDGGSDSSLS
ncbi:hypothetical protein [Bradyrhizobium sp.]|uniref:hypothetical protein n=1 Tax=Bradyrhizobium sp. TaxID=376 RepID=UPI003C70442A